MDKKKEPILSGVPETLLIPLYNRAMESRRPDAMIRDAKAVELVERTGLDFSRVEQVRITRLLGLMRIIFTREFDRFAREFLARHPDAAVVHIGCGFDTRFERVDNGRVEWYDLDLPEVADLRRKLIGGDAGRYHLLGCSVLEDSWMKAVKVRASRPVLLLAETVFLYFREVQVRRLIPRCRPASRARSWPSTLGSRSKSGSPTAISPDRRSAASCGGACGAEGRWRAGEMGSVCSTSGASSTGPSRG